jgi:hypothetical protein
MSPTSRCVDAARNWARFLRKNHRSSIAATAPWGRSSFVSGHSSFRSERRNMPGSMRSQKPPESCRWEFQPPHSGTFIELLLPAMNRHSPAPSLAQSGVGSTQEAAIQFATLNVASSAIADIQASELVRRLRVGFLTFAPRQPRMSGSLQGDANSRPGDCQSYR